MDESPIESIKTSDSLEDDELDNIAREFNLEFSLRNIFSIREKIYGLKKKIEDLFDYFEASFFEKEIKSGNLKSWAEVLLQKTESFIGFASKLESDFNSMCDTYKYSKPGVVDGNPNHNPNPTDSTLDDTAGDALNSIYECLAEIRGHLNQMRKKLSEALELEK